MERRRDLHAQSARRNLEDYAASRCKTILIGCLEEFENGFGYLWGHGQPYSALTDTQKDMYELWKEVRYEILSRGEFRINQLKTKFDHYDIHNKKSYDFKLEQDRKDEDNL